MSWYLVVVLLVFVGACFQQFTAHAALLCYQTLFRQQPGLMTPSLNCLLTFYVVLSFISLTLVFNTPSIRALMSDPYVLLAST